MSKITDEIYDSDNWGEWIRTTLEYSFEEKIKEQIKTRVKPILKRRVKIIIDDQINSIDDIIVEIMAELLPQIIYETLSHSIYKGIGDREIKLKTETMTNIKNNIRKRLNIGLF